jgi:protein-tyrosine phosphatase
MPEIHAHRIAPRLWLGDRISALDEDFLSDENISTVFNCTKDFPFSPMINRKYRVPVDDNLQPAEINNMERWAPEIVYKVVSEYKQGHTILIHCHAGMQRSAAVMAMTLIALTGKTPDEVMDHIQSIRSVAFQPSANFEKSIRGFNRKFREAMNE